MRLYKKAYPFYALGRKAILRNPLRIYHQDHDSTEMSARPDTERMLRSRKPIILNDEDWGLGHEDLPECTIGSRDR